MSFNKTTLIGHIGREPEIRVTQSNRKVATFNVATNADYKNKSGELVKVTHWHQVKTWSQGLIDKVLIPYAKTGTQVLVEGTLEYDTWLDKNTKQKRRAAVVMIGPNGIFQILDKKENAKTDETNAPSPEVMAPISIEDDDEIPF